VEITSQEILDAWQVLSSVYSSRGIDLDKLLNEATTSKPEWLSSWRYKADFEKLREAGCSEVALLVALWIIRSAPSWSNTWRVVVGQRRSRDQFISALEKAASALERFENSFDGSLSRNKSWAKRETVLPKTNALTPDVPDVELPRVPAPDAVIRALRTYSRVLKGFDEVARRTRINSPETFGKYLISDFVKTVTGEYHDKEVSTLIEGALGGSYSETAHRMWRSRNYKHLEAVSFPVELLLGIGILVAIKQA
jgi:hypothetical protein